VEREFELRGDNIPEQPGIYHRILVRGPAELALVRESGVLWGKVARIVAGNGPACVHAYVGPLRTGESG
jgi:hypothetical protein